MKNEYPIKSANLVMLAFVAAKLEELCDDIVFLSGCATALLINDPVSPVNTGKRSKKIFFIKTAGEKIVIAV